MCSQGLGSGTAARGGADAMSRGVQDLAPRPLCGGRLLTPVFDPPLVRCRACGLVFRDQEAAQEQVREEFEVIYGDPQDEQRIQERRRPLYQEFLAQYRPLPGRNRHLDVGCGDGQFLRLARERGWDVVGTEIVEAAAQAARAAELPVRLGALATATLPESSFNVVTLWNVLDFIPNPVAEIRAAQRILARGDCWFSG